MRSCSNFRDESEVLSKLFGGISDPCSWLYSDTFSNDAYYDDYDYDFHVLTCSQLPEDNVTKVTGL